MPYDKPTDLARAYQLQADLLRSLKVAMEAMGDGGRGYMTDMEWLDAQAAITNAEESRP